MWGGDVTNGLSRAPVLQPDHKSRCLCPEELRQARLNEKGPDTLHNAMIEGLGHAVVLRCVMSGELAFSALLLEEFGECVASILPAAV